MVIARTQIVKQLEPGLNAIFGGEYKQYADEGAVLFNTETSQRAFEEEVLFPGFAGAQVKQEGAPVTFADTGEGWVARYNHETVALAFAITEEAMEDNLYDTLSTRLSRALAISMAHTKQVKAANIYNNHVATAQTGGDGVTLINAAHPMQDGNTQSNRLTTDSDLSETSLEEMLIQIAGATDEKSIPAAIQGNSLHLPRQLLYVAERILKSPYRTQTADNDINAIYSLGKLPKGYYVNHRFTDPDAWFVRTDIANGMKHFERVSIATGMEGDFETGNVRYKARERYSYGWSDWRALYATPGS